MPSHYGRHVDGSCFWGCALCCPGVELAVPDLETAKWAADNHDATEHSGPTREECVNKFKRAKTEPAIERASKKLPWDARCSVCGDVIAYCLCGPRRRRTA